MPKAKLSQIATTWVDEEDGFKKKMSHQEKNVSGVELKKKQTFSLKVDTIKRLWMHRVRTDKTLSKIMDELVLKHLPAVNIDKEEKNRKTHS